MLKKFIVKVLLFAICTGIFAEAFCVLVDPYNVFHPEEIVDNGVEPNKNYLKMRNVLSNSEWFDGYLFGSSRVGSIHIENMGEEKIYNMTYSEGTPYEHLANLKTMLAAEVKIKKIYMGIDSLSYTIDPIKHKNEGIQAPYELYKEDPLSFFKLYLDPAVIAKAAGIVLTYHDKNPDHDAWVYDFYHYGWTVGYGGGWFDADRAYPVVGDAYRYDETLAEIKEIVEICEANDIELLVFTNPMYYVTYEASLELNYLDFLKDLAAITSFYNFSGYNFVATNPGKFNDPSHYTAEVGDEMIQMMVYGSQLEYNLALGYGYRADKDNIDELLALLEEGRATFLKQGQW